MYRIDSTANEITPLNKATFSSLDIKEREHLQEWIAKHPKSLGEDLLIIQKEFNGFDETMERLDLLALDKNGDLVVIENKLDDSGRDVVWQGLKYAGYCANMTSLQVIEVYEQYLSKHPPQLEQSAKERIAEFLYQENEGDNELTLNKKQRIIFVAANFRKEVTNTVLWLAQYGVACKCIKVTPYIHGKEKFLNVEQIIPTPESEDFMIGIQEKKAEEQRQESGKARRRRIRQNFWAYVLPRLGQKNIAFFKDRTPQKDNWMSTSFVMSDMYLQLVFGQKFARIELQIYASDKARNKEIYTLMHKIVRMK
ncbi:DUF4268 domain-containing protein [Oleidesulfovibrio sp.]|uniref:DUF4268 domain-containing protein n=1 Tax=Oleidesulfovibrio sp. TaxID=2909707 RepID=UPI003A897BC8